MQRPEELGWSFAAIERDPQDLFSAGLRPVWTFEDGYPGPLPADMADWISPEQTRKPSARLIGPLQSLCWLAKLDYLVSATDDPAYILRDVVVCIPQDVSIRFILHRLREEGKIPCAMCHHHSALSQSARSFSCMRPGFPIPSTITRSLTLQSLSELFPAYRRQSLPQEVHCVRVSFNKNTERLATDIDRDLTGLSDASLLYRGVSRMALVWFMSCVAVMKLSPTVGDKEFGPGLYTTTSMEHAIMHAGSQGALMVFQNPDFQNLNVWEPRENEWHAITACMSTLSGLTLNAPPEHLPDGWYDPDIIRGAISRAGHGPRAPRIPGPDTQVVGASWAGCLALAASLKMIVWFD